MTNQPTPSDRATEFQAVQGNGAEHYSGEVLLVAAYAVLWVVIFAWIGLVWRKQRGLDDRLSELERVLDKAAAEGDKADKKPA
jgi:CcmD family protein